MIYAKKTLGVYKDTVQQEASHVILTLEEYCALQESEKLYRSKTASLRQATIILKDELQTSQAKCANLEKTVHAFEVTVYEKDSSIKSLNAEKAELSAKYEAARKAALHEKSLNTNLLRISRERANAVRGISPKKDHDGYVVLQSSAWRERLDGKNTVVATKTTIQTPYDASIAPDIAREEIINGIKRILFEIGCENYSSTGFNEDGEYRMYDKGNLLYRCTLTANYRTGFWVIVLYTTKPLTIPPNRRAAFYIKAPKKAANIH